MNKSEIEVLLFCFDKQKYPLGDKKKKNKYGITEAYKRHINAFARLKKKKLTELNEFRIWTITEPGKKKIISENEKMENKNGL